VGEAGPGAAAARDRYELGRVTVVACAAPIGFGTDLSRVGSGAAAGRAFTGGDSARGRSSHASHHLARAVLVRLDGVDPVVRTLPSGRVSPAARGRAGSRSVRLRPGPQPDAGSARSPG